MFMPSGCLTGDALMLYVSGSLQGEEFALAQLHVATCSMCADSVDGLRMWLGETKPATGSSDRKDIHAIETPEFAENHPITRSHSNKTPILLLNEFRVRTESINDRIKERIHSHAKAEPDERRKLSYKPFVWLSVAATVVLFAGVFYAVWVQKFPGYGEMAQKPTEEMIPPSTPGDTASTHRNKTDLALNSKKLGEKVRFSAPVVVSEEVTDMDLYNQDELNSSNEVLAAPEALPGEDVTGKKGESTAIVENKASSIANKKDAEMAANKAEIAEDSRSVFTVVEEMPSFPGGEAERNKFLSGNIVYPQQAVENGIQGTVYIRFVVDVKGNITEVKVLRGIGGGCDEEALRVVKMMPKWHPGKQNGEKVRVLYNMPVIFKLSQ